MKTRPTCVAALSTSSAHGHAAHAAPFLPATGPFLPAWPPPTAPPRPPPPPSQCVGPLLTIWFDALDKYIPGQTWQPVARRTALDQLIEAPLMISLIFGLSALLEGRGMRFAILKIQAKASGDRGFVRRRERGLGRLVRGGHAMRLPPPAPPPSVSHHCSNADLGRLGQERVHLGAVPSLQPGHRAAAVRRDHAAASRTTCSSPHHAAAHCPPPRTLTPHAHAQVPGALPSHLQLLLGLVPEHPEPLAGPVRVGGGPRGPCFKLIMLSTPCLRTERYSSYSPGMPTCTYRPTAAVPTNTYRPPVVAAVGRAAPHFVSELASARVLPPAWCMLERDA